MNSCAALRLAVISALCAVSAACTTLENPQPRVTQLLKTTTSWDGQAIVYPAGQPEVTGLLIELAPGQETGWHLHPSPSFAVILEGELEVMLKNGKKIQLRAGDPLAEVVNTPHNGRNIGTTPLKIVVFYAGIVGRKLTQELRD